MNFLTWLWDRYKEAKADRIPSPESKPRLEVPDWVKKMIASKRFWVLLVIAIVTLILVRKKGFWIFIGAATAFIGLWHNLGFINAAVILITGGFGIYILNKKMQTTNRSNN